MSSLSADLTKLVSSIGKLENIDNSIAASTDTLISDSIESIKKVGSRHDDCFNSIDSTAFSNSISDTSTGFLSLEDNIDKTIRLILAYNNSLNENIFNTKVDSIKISGLSKALDWEINNSNSTLADMISKDEIKANYDYKYYNNLLNQVLDSLDTTREKTTMSAIFLATVFPHLPYFWGGGHEKNCLGVDPEWGSEKQVTAAGSSTTGKYLPYSLDCSGYVSWSLFNGGVKNGAQDCKLTSENYADYGEKMSITSADVYNKVEPGDLAYMSGHIGVIISKKDNNLVIAHCSGSGEGMNITKISTETGKVVEDSSKPDRAGENYFTDVIAMDY